MQEVALGGGAEGPHVTVVSVLPPAGLVGTDHRTASDPFHDVGHHPLGSVGHPWCGAHAETPTMHRSQVPLDGTEGQPGLFPQRGNQADQVDPQALLAQHHLVQLRRWHPAAMTLGAGAGDIGVLGYLHRNLGQLDDLPSALGPAPGQDWIPQSGHRSSACSTRWSGVILVRAKPERRGWRGFLGRSALPSPLGFRPGIRPEPPDLPLPSNWATRFSRRSMMACCRMMMPMSTSRSAVRRSISPSIPAI